MKKINLIILILLLSIPSLPSWSGVGDTYVCKEEKENIAGYKSEFILYWNENTYDKKYKQVVGSGDSSGTFNFTVHTPKYFVSLRKYLDGHLVNTFNGNTYANVFVRNYYTASFLYNCVQF